MPQERPSLGAPGSGGGAVSRADRTIGPMRLDPNPSHYRPVHQPGRPKRDLSRPLPSALSWTVLVVSALRWRPRVAGGLPWWIPAWYAAVSLVAFVAYGLDKRAAKRVRRASRSRRCS